MVNPNNNWRNDPGLACVTEYRKKFAIKPITCSDGAKIWWKYFYQRFDIWSCGGSRVFNDEKYGHTEYIESITEAEYIIRKLSGTL